jgi:hypothetical protein
MRETPDTLVSLAIFSFLLENAFELRQPLGYLLLPPQLLFAPAFRLGGLVRELAALVGRVGRRHVSNSSSAAPISLRWVRFATSLSENSEDGSRFIAP